MKVLYFLEPNIELNNEKFRLGTVRNHLDKEINNLKKHSDVSVKLILSDVVYKASLSEGLLNDVDAVVIPQKEIQKTLGNSLELYLNYMNNREELNYSKEIAYYKNKLNDYVPDVIVCYECLAPYLNKIFPKAVSVNNTLGMLSRAPYPEMTALDPVGIYKDAFVNKRKDSIRDYKPSQRDVDFVESFRTSVTSALNSKKHELEHVLTGFDRYVILPLQVSNYFAFDGCCNYSSQLDFVEDVLANTPDDVAIVATVHGVENNVFETDKGKEIKEKYKNLIVSNTINNLRWSSQHLLPHCDGVISVSSSVALTAMLWKLPVYSPAQSHLSIISTESYREFFETVKRGTKFDYHGTLEFWLTKYNVTTQELHNSDYLYRFLSLSIEYFKSNKDFDCEFYNKVSNKNIVALYTESRFSTLGIENEKYTPSMKCDFSTPMEHMEKAFSGVDVISFDVFDTLISRNIYNPNSLFDLMQHEVSRYCIAEGVDLDKFGGFRKLRERAANRVIRFNKRKKIGEITLKEIYNEIRVLTGITPELELKLRKLEISYEISVSVKRDYGFKLFNLARDLGKKIIIISDMYLASADIELLLKKSGYDLSNVDIYVSSSYGCTKKDGGLFHIVKENMDKNVDLLHIGDNYHSDYVQARNAGFWSIHIPCASLNYESSFYAKNNLNRDLINQSLGSNIHYGLVSRKFFDKNNMPDSFFDSNLEQLGFSSCGPIMLGFVKWICQKLRENNIEKVYFLARDGYLVKEVYDSLRAYDQTLPESEYILASRRCFSTASFTCENDILESVSLSFSQNTVGFVLKQRYNIESVSDEVLKEAGFDNIDDIVDIKRGSHKRRFLRLLSLLKDQILHIASEEKSALKVYLDSKGVLDKSVKKCVVDIGHNATLQKYLSEIAGDVFHGLYFMTFSAAEKVNDTGLPVNGYLADFEDQKLSSHPYVKNIGMFEFLFLPSIPSFERFELVDGELVEHYVSGDESARFKLIEQVHKGARNYVKEVLRITNGNLGLYDLSKNHCVKNYIDFVESPCVKDVRPLIGVYFVDGFGGNDQRFLVSNDASLSDDLFISQSWWRNGARAIINGTTPMSDYSLLNVGKYENKPKRNKKVRIRNKLIKLISKPHVVIKNRFIKHVLSAS